MNRRRVLIAAGALAASMLAVTAHAQQFPERPVRIVVPFAPGNTLDAALRQMGEEWTRNTGQQLLIDNKPGGAGIIAAQAVKNAAPDGYTVLMSNTSMFAVNPHTFSKLPYDPVRDYKPVTGAVGASMVIAVPSRVPAQDLKQFIAWVKANPGKTSFASFTAGNSSHFMGVMLNLRAGLDMVHVPFNGTPPAVQNLVAGQVDAAFLPLLAVKPHVESGKVRVLAVSSPKRSPLLPDVPTFREAGFPDLETYIWSGFSVPAATPDAIVARLNTEFNRAMSTPTVREQWRAVDFEPLIFTPQEYAAFVARDSKRWAEAVKASGFKAD